jgi:hypothetical protein
MGNVIFNIVDLLLRALRDERNLCKQSINLKKKVKPLIAVYEVLKFSLLIFDQVLLGLHWLKNGWDVSASIFFCLSGQNTWPQLRSKRGTLF